MARNLLDSTPLEDEQRELLQALVEASRNVPRDQREEFVAIVTLGSSLSSVKHPGLPGKTASAYGGDILEAWPKTSVRRTDAS